MWIFVRVLKGVCGSSQESFSEGVRSNAVCCERLLILQKKKSTNKESQKKCLKYENRLPKASVFVICSLLNIISCNYCKPCKTASGEFRHICDTYIIMIIKHPSGYTHDNVVLLSYVSISFLIYIFSATCDVLLKIPNLFSCTSFKFLLLGRDCYFFSLTLGHSNYLFIFT